VDKTSASLKMGVALDWLSFKMETEPIQGMTNFHCVKIQPRTRQKAEQIAHPT